MDLKFSHVDVLVKNLDEACAYYAQILNARISKTLVWERGGLHVRYAIALMGQERFMLVQPCHHRRFRHLPCCGLQCALGRYAVHGYPTIRRLRCAVRGDGC